MPIYRYVGLDAQGKKRRGTVEAADLQRARTRLATQSLIVIELSDLTRKERPFFPSSFSMERKSRPMAMKTFLLFVQQFSALLKAGIPIVRALQLMADETRDKRLKVILIDAIEHIAAGSTLSSALSLHSGVFPPFFVALIRSGEQSGELATALAQAAEFYEKQHTTREEIKSALIYPAVITVSALSTMLFMLFFAVPRFAGLYTDFGVSIPGPTQFLLDLSDIVRTYGWLIAAIPLIMWASTQLFRHASFVKRLRFIGDQLLLHMPVMSGIQIKGAHARLARTLATFYRAGVPLTQALRAGQELLGNAIYRRSLKGVIERVEGGEPLSRAFRNTHTWTPLFVHMVEIGEATGELEETLEKLASFYEQDVAQTVTRFKALIEPTLIVLLMVLVGGLMLLMFIPMLSMYQQFV